MTTVAMHFGDGTFHLIQVTATEEDEALEEAREWVRDNAWFEVENIENEKGEELPLVGPHDR